MTETKAQRWNTPHLVVHDALRAPRLHRPYYPYALYEDQLLTYAPSLPPSVEFNVALRPGPSGPASPAFGVRASDEPGNSLGPLPPPSPSTSAMIPPEVSSCATPPFQRAVSKILS